MNSPAWRERPDTSGQTGFCQRGSPSAFATRRDLVDEAFNAARQFGAMRRDGHFLQGCSRLRSLIGSSGPLTPPERSTA